MKACWIFYGLSVVKRDTHRELYAMIYIKNMQFLSSRQLGNGTRLGMAAFAAGCWTVETFIHGHKYLSSHARQLGLFMQPETSFRQPVLWILPLSSEHHFLTVEG